MSKYKFTKKSKRVFELTQKMLDGLINDDEGVELNELIKDDEELQILYLSLREQELELEERFHSSQVSDRPLSGDLTSLPPVKKESRLIYYLLIPCLILTGFILGFSLKKTPEIKTVQTTHTDQEASAEIQKTIASVHLSLNVDNPALAKDKSLFAGIYRLKTGQISLDMSEGMQITIEAPARFNLIDSNSIEIYQGKYRFDSLLDRPGFKVKTPYGSLIDQNADFGLSISDEEALAQCFKGAIDLIQKNQTRQIVAPQTEILMKKSTQKAPQFLSFNQLQDLAQKRNNDQFANWLETRDKLKGEPDTAFFYDFIPNVYAFDNLTQKAYRGEVAPAHGKIIGANWTQGRFPGTHSLNFEKSNDRVKFHLDEKFSQMTIHLWLKINQSLDKNIHGILLSEQYEDHQIFLQLITRDENWHYKFSAKGHFVCTTKPFTEEEHVGKWHLISLIMDAPNKEVKIYMNGENVSGTLRMNNPDPVYPGWVDLMNWVPNRIDDIRNTPGQVDFFSVHRRVFSEDEIKDFYQNSRHD